MTVKLKGKKDGVNKRKIYHWTLCNIMLPTTQLRSHNGNNGCGKKCADMTEVKRLHTDMHFQWHDDHVQENSSRFLKANGGWILADISEIHLQGILLKHLSKIMCCYVWIKPCPISPSVLPVTSKAQPTGLGSLWLRGGGGVERLCSFSRSFRSAPGLQAVYMMLRL